MHLKSRIWTVAALFVAAALGRPVAHGEEPLSEYKLKAAFLYNFTKFIEWPTNAFDKTNAPLVIGIAGDNPFGDHLERTIRGKKINEHPLVLKQVRSLTDSRVCHVLFISRSERRRAPEILAGLKGYSVLTVGEWPGFLEAGGMISFVIEEDKIRFDISDSAARRAGLRISSKLLNLARKTAKTAAATLPSIRRPSGA
jgi:hypothetical protein